MPSRRLFYFFACAATLLLTGADAPKGQIAADQSALKAVQAYVGEWKGVGQPRRGSSDGAWIEEGEWAWKFDKEHAWLVGKNTDAKFYRQFEVRPGDKHGKFTLSAYTAEGEQPEIFKGLLDEADNLVVTAAAPKSDRPARITIRMVAGGDRLLVLYEKRGPGDQFSRLAEVGSTRKGAAFAKGDGFPECIVTGGRGTIAVEYQGKTYYVCCTGCRDLFKDDPEGTLAAYHAKKAKEAKDAAK